MGPRVSAESPAAALTIPELGPSFGRLTDPPEHPPVRGPFRLGLDDLRLELVTGLFELAGAARSRAAGGDPAGAARSLAGAAWLAAWEQAAASAGERLAGLVNAGFQSAAAESRLPTRRLDPLLLTPDDAHDLSARLAGGDGAPAFIAALDALDATAPVASDDRRGGEWDGWIRALAAAARRLESAWLGLEAAADAEQRYWQAEVERVRTWRRALWPLWLITGLLLAAATYLGLVLGGYLPVPAPLRGFAELWWTRL